MLRTRILASARDIRQRTGLADTRVSVACVGARRLIQAGSRLAVVGVGEMGRHALEVLARLGSRDVLVVNRTLSKAAKLAAHYGYRAQSLAEFRRNPPPLDGVLLAVTSPEPILNSEMVPGLRLAVDLSLPSVLAADLGEQCGLTILRLDDIGKIASTEAHERAAAADLAEKLILARAKQIHREIDSGRVNLGSVIDRHVTNAMDELELAFRGNLAHLSDADQNSLRQVLDRLARRNAHFHIQDLKELVGP